jgi:hypothetical protein
MERKLTEIFTFLQENREYNKKVQEYFYNYPIISGTLLEEIKGIMQISDIGGKFIVKELKLDKFSI